VFDAEHIVLEDYTQIQDTYAGNKIVQEVGTGNGEITDVFISDGGQSYQNLPAITINTATGNSGILKAYGSQIGRITGIKTTELGVGYDTPPTPPQTQRIETPDGLGNENEDRIIFVNNKADDKLWLTGTIVAVMAFLVGLGVYFYTEIYGNCLNKDRKNIVLFDDPVKGTATDAATLGAFQNDFYEPQKRLPTTYDDNLNYQDNDDNVSEISVSSEIKKDQALHMVFDTIFDSDPGKL
jgi:hypothetical protein